MSAYNFGAPASTAASSGSLFGSASNTGNSTGGIFGQRTATGSGSTGFGFGGSFGTTPASTGSEQTTATSTASPINGSFGTPARTSSPATTGTSLFGSTTPAATGAANTFSFGNPSTTPAGPPPAISGFGASTGGASIFGGSKKAQDTSSQFSGFSLGPPASNSTPSSSLNTQSMLTGGGGGSGSGGGMFKLPAAPKTSEAASNTGSNTPSTNTTLFGSMQPSTSAPTGASLNPTPSLFAPSSGTQSSPSLFAPQPDSSTTRPQDNAFSLFAKPNMTPSDSTNKPAFSFPSASTPAATPSAQKPLFSGLGGPPAPNSATPSLFSPPAAPSSSQTPATTSTGPKPLFGGIGAPATTASSSGTLFGQPAPSAATSTSASTETAKPTTTTASTAPGFFTFGNLNASAASQPPTQATASALSLAAPSIGQPATGTPAAASTSGPAPPAQSRLRNKTMDEILTRWATDLTKYTKEFRNQAETVAKWDQIIVDNSSKIDKLYVQTRTCEKQTMSVDVQLTAIENQQAELESWLTKYENDVDEMLTRDGANSSELGGPDQERERTYRLAERLGDRLEDMGRDLESMVEEINAANASLNKGGKADEPITQIVKILNSHLSQLQAIDQGTAALQAKLTTAQKNSTGMGFATDGVNGDGRAAVEDFYRSYMGRR